MDGQQTSPCEIACQAAACQAAVKQLSSSGRRRAAARSSPLDGESFRNARGESRPLRSAGGSLANSAHRRLASLATLVEAANQTPEQALATERECHARIKGSANVSSVFAL